MKTRPINQIIYKNLILQNIFYPPLLLYHLFDIWDYNTGQLIGELGCSLCIYAGVFIINHDRAHSLFINLFRYICIVKEESIRENHILPKVSSLILSFPIYNSIYQKKTMQIVGSCLVHHSCSDYCDFL